ncbi:MAG TPA: glucoamylase family protein [Terriglobales bacterium]|nr:glucoamylase family protein [Terriglobales bacterium]
MGLPVTMFSTRRQFLRVALTGAATLPIAGKVVASDLLTGPADLPPNDEGLLNDIQRAAFEFFWNEADPQTGMVADRANAAGGNSYGISSIAATGFGLTALCIGAEREYRPSAQIEQRVSQTLEFLASQVPTQHGFFYHFLDPATGRRVKHCEVSPMDTAILLCGVLTCREYFTNADIRRDATTIYNRVEWPWALNGGKTFALDWRPEYQFSRLRWDSYCESMMLYLLAMGSPTHPIPSDCWTAISRPKMVYRGHQYISSPAPLFVHQFSHAWFDFRSKHDEYANYFENSVIASLAHREFCEELSHRFPCYSKDVWGISASESSTGYVAWGGPPILGPIDGSIVPAASAGSLPFLFRESMTVLQNLRRYYGKQIWKEYGFVDAFNPLTGWVSRDVIGIDVGITMLMAENARTQFVWNTFMRNPEAGNAMQLAGFLPDGFEVPMMA